MNKEKINLVNFFIRKSEYFLSIGTVIAAIFLISFSIYRSNLNYFLCGFFLLLCMSVYFFIKNHNITQNETRPYSVKINKIIDIFFILLYILGIISLYFYPIPYERPITFFLIFICMLSSVLIQILLGDMNYFKLLIKIIFLVLFYILSQVLLFKSLMSIDSYDHMFYTNIIMNTGSTPQISIPYSYLFHILHAQIQMISGLDYNYSNLLFVLPGIMIVTVFTIFLIGRKLVTPQVGLLASFILICSTSFLNFSINLIPNSYSSIFLLMAILFILKRCNSNHYTLNSIILLFFIILTTITHATTNIILILFLVIFYIFIHQMTNGASKTMKLDLVLIFFSIIIMLAWWIYAVHIFEFPIKVLLSGFDVYKFQLANDIIREQGLLHLSIIESFHTIMSYFLFWIIGIPGCVYLTRNYYKNKNGFAFSFSGLSLLIFLSLIIISGREMINIRYYYLITFFFCIFAAIFVVLIFQSTRKSFIKIAIIIIILSVCSISITHPGANITNPVFTLVGDPQIYPFESELFMLSSLRTIESEPLASDGTIYYTEKMSGRADITDITADFKYMDFSNARDKTIILSDSIFKKTIGTEVKIPEKDLVIYSIDVNRFSKFFDVGRARSYIYS